MLRSFLLIGLGGAAGSILRYIVSQWVRKYYNDSFPLATFIVNVAGCFAIGLLLGWLDRVRPADDGLRLLFITGFCGGFTTFSAFANENFLLMKGGNFLVAAAYISASVAFGLAAVWAGSLLTK